MSKIKILPEELINKIAAGEVVERPASVIKELVENALDAGSSRIEITVSGAGTTELTVSDNGQGMDRHDLLMALERHATSKITSYDELIQINTQGFRGEALPSIAGVSVMEIISRPRGELGGYRISAAGGKIRDVSETGAPEGTTVRVRRLFYNTPARRKFLKTPPTEWGHILRTVTAAALANPEVAFRLEHDGSSSLLLPIAESLLDRLGDLWGNEISRSLIPILKEKGPVAVTGFLSGPEDSARLRKGLFLLVNGRPVQNRMILGALREAFGPRLPRGVFPMGVLSLAIDPRQVDVNIHPAKREVAFSSPGLIRSMVKASVEEALGHRRPVASFSPESDTEGEIYLRSFQKKGYVSDYEPSQKNLGFVSPKEGLGSYFQPQERGTEFRLIGQLGCSYLVFEGPEGLILVDQHAAHERILYEQFTDLFKTGIQETQTLLAPIPLEVDGVASALLGQRVEALSRLGINIEEFGGESWIITGLPSLLTGREKESLVLETLAGIEDWGAEPGDPRERLIIQLACKAAVKAGQKAAAPAARQLMHQLLECRDPSCCPHGRPTMLNYSWKELERKFGRKG